MKNNLYLSFLLVLVIAFTCKIIFLYHPDDFSKFFQKVKFNYVVLKNNAKCNIQSIKYIPKNSTVIVGHFYGHPSVSEDRPLGVLPSFLSKNNSQIKLLVFTGDIFKVPSKEKWASLSSLLKENKISFFIAPGNHDYFYDNEDMKQEFTSFFNFNYPISWSSQGSLYIIEDSTSLNWSLSSESHYLIDTFKDIDSSLYIFAHNTLSQEMSIFANSSVGKPETLPSIEKLLLGKEKLYREVFIISGDTGAANYMPSKTCNYFNNVTSIANGLGNRKNNEILLIDSNEIFSYKLGSY